MMISEVKGNLLAFEEALIIKGRAVVCLNSELDSSSLPFEVGQS